MAKKLADDVKLRRKIRRTLESKKNYLDKPERENYRNVINIFLEKFILCEIATKSVLSFYYKNNNIEKDANDNNIHMKDIENALIQAGYAISANMLSAMFKKNTKRGEKSCRDLRNSIVHDLSSNDIRELVNRCNDINQILDDYLNIIMNEPLE